MLVDQLDEIVCDACSYPQARIRLMTRTYGRGEDLLVVENVPVISCPHCGTSYLTAETMRKLDYIKQERKALTVTRPVKVAAFS